MYISNIRIQNYRCFDDTVIELNEGLNVFIGENNCGKTTVLKAIQYVFNTTSQGSPSVDDFHKLTSIDDAPPGITITLILKSSKSDRVEDRAVVASWLTKIEKDWEATLTYKFFLPENNKQEYIDEIARINASDIINKESRKWSALDRFLKKYVSRVYAGNIESKIKAEPEYLNKFHCELLDALRDVESKMFTGRNTLLKQVLNHFIDSDLNEKGLSEEEKADEIKIRDFEFVKNSDTLITKVIDRLKDSKIFELAEKTGATVGGVPKLNGQLAEGDVLSVLKLMINKETGIEIPIINNGMGYNNLVFMSLVLSKFKMMMSKEMGENAKVFPILLIEEPEAHLHPALQYNFLKFIKKEIDKQEISRQIFVTTHSTHITAAVGLDPIICLNVNEDKKLVSAYPGRVFSSEKEDIESKKYIQRFLDATKSNILFSKSVIFVEGIAEQILLPILAEYEKKDLEKNHVAIIRVDALTFKHFVKLFGAGVKETLKKFAISKKVCCIIDSDPTKQSKAEGTKKYWHKCWPFEVGTKTDEFEYKSVSGAATNLLAFEGEQSRNRLKISCNNNGKGKTFEYDIAYCNTDSELLFNENVEINEFPALHLSTWTPDEKEKAKKAASYLMYVEGVKGEAAFNLAETLRENLSKSADKQKPFKVPDHITEAFKWVCKVETEVE